MNIDTYAYLLLGLFFLALWILCFVLRKDLRPIMLRLSFLGAVCGPLSELWYFRDYWLPPTIVGQGVLSPEDVVFGFATFGLGAVTLAFLSGKHFVPSGSPYPKIFPVFILSFFAGFFLFTNLLGLNSIVTACLVMLLWSVALTLMRPDLLIPSFLNGLLLAALSVAIYTLLLDASAAYLERYWFLWNKPLGLMIFDGVPVTEIVWYFLLGTSVFSVAAYGEGKKLV